MSNWELVTYIYIVIMLVFNVVVTVIVSIGGCFDLTYLFRILSSKIVDETDDGRVVSHDSTDTA